jgi:hypothetical protein
VALTPGELHELAKAALSGEAVVEDNVEGGASLGSTPGAALGGGRTVALRSRGLSLARPDALTSLEESRWCGLGVAKSASGGPRRPRGVPRPVTPGRSSVCVRDAESPWKPLGRMNVDPGES